MLKTRVIPCLLLKGRGLVKTVKFQNPKYVGDPINAVRIFNDKEVDELVFLDITATMERHAPQFELIKDIATECFMPFGYGGGIRTIEDASRILKLGAEKIIVNTYGIERPTFIREAADIFGSQSVVAAIDAKRESSGGYTVYTHGGTKSTNLSPFGVAKTAERMGAGEVFINSIDRDGTQGGYDLDLIKGVTKCVGIPVIACGGAGKLQDLQDAVVKGGASAVAAGSLFVFHGPHRAVLINYPSQEAIKEYLD